MLLPLLLGEGRGEGVADDIVIPGLIPHAGGMCLLDGVVHWTTERIACRAVSHLDPLNPLRRGDQLAMLCGIEYALQAAALHGALVADAPQPRGYLAGLRLSHLAAGRLDDPGLGTLAAHARREHSDATGLLYAIRLDAGDGRVLLDGRATIILTRP